MERLAHTHPDDRTELLSAYSDNVADVLERRRAEEAIASCAACAHEVRELKLFKSLLRDLPNVQPPRSFTIDPATAPRPRWLLFPTLRLASALAAMLLVLVLGVDNLLPTSNSSAGSSMTAAQAPAPAARSLGNAPESQLYLDASGAASTAAMAEALQASVAAAASTAADTAAASTAASAPAMAAAPEASVAAAAGAAPAASADAQADAAPPAEQDSAGATAATAASTDATLKSQTTAGENTESATASRDGYAAARSGFDTLVLLEVLLGAAALAFGVGAVIAWRRGV